MDFLILGDGYTEAERAKFEKDARKLVDILFSYSPFKERKADFNVWGLMPKAAESGISRPSTGVHRRPPLGSTYDAFGAERYILTFDNAALRDTAAFAPYEFVEILSNGNTSAGENQIMRFCSSLQRLKGSLSAIRNNAKILHFATQAQQ